MCKIIAESELILNARGAIYHLNLKEEELADTVITVGDPGRVQEISKHFDSIEVQQQHREFITHTGRIGSKRISCISSGIGPDNIDIVLNEIDALKNIDFHTRTIKPTHSSLQIIRIGTCGALQEDIPVNAMVVGTHGLGLDNLLHYYNLEHNDEEEDLLKKFAQHTGLNTSLSSPYIAAASDELLQHFTTNYHHGITITCPGFYAPQGRMLRLTPRYPKLVNQFTSFQYQQHKIANFEMETSAIYGMGKLLRHKCLSINTVIANRITKTFSKNPQLAVNKTIEQVIQTIASI